MNETLITDLVAQQALDQLDELDRKMEGTLTQFQDCARELARGIKIPVEVTGDLERLRELANATMQRAGQAAQQYTQQLQQQQQVIANTTNTISRQLMEQERLNKAQREAYQQNESALQVANRILGSHEQNIRALADYERQLKQLKAERKAGTVSDEDYIRRELELKTVKQEVQRVLNNETKMNQAAAGSYQQLSLQLERMKMAQKQLNEEEKNGATGQALEKEIQELDAHLKDLAADMGEFQRNVGNYAIANGNLKTELRELTAQMAQMLADGVDPTSEEFLTLAERAGTLKDAMSDAQATVKDYADDTRGLAATTSVLQTAIGGWQTMAGAMTIFGEKNEDAAKTTQKLMSIMSLMNGIQKISTELTTNGTGAYRAYHAILKLLGIEKTAVVAATEAEVVATETNVAAATEAAAAETANATSTTAATAASGAHTAALATETTALKGATAASVALRVALAALGVGAVIALIAALCETVKEFNKGAEEAAKITEGMNDAMKESTKSTASVAAELKYYKGVVDGFNGSVEEEKRLVDELNAKYGESLGYYQKLAQWKSALADMSETYLDVLKWEARAQAYLNKYAEASANNQYEEAAAYEKEFEFFKSMAAEQSKVLNNMIKLRGASTTKPTTTTTKSSGSSGDSKADVEAKMKELIDESNEILDEWQQNVTKRLIEIESAVVSTSSDALRDQMLVVSEQYDVVAGDIVEKRKAAVAEKEKEFAEAIAAAKKYGEDTTQLEDARITAITALNNEYKRQIEENEREKNETLKSMASDYVNLVRAENERQIADIVARNAAIMNINREQYLRELREAEGNEKKIAEIKRRYATESAERAEKTAIEVARAQIAGLEKVLAVEELSDADREKIARQLATAKQKLADAVNNAEENALKRTSKAEEDASKERLKNFEQWGQKTGQAISQVGAMFSAMYDRQISAIDEMMSKEQEHYDKQVEEIEYLAEIGAITAEEAEARKRVAAQETERKQEELEKKKAAIEYKKAVMEKANSIAQIGIATALGIMQALAMWPPNIALAAFVGAMGAVQVATALAQPIKAYKEGTKGKPHPGGLALVGDGDKAEVVMYDGKAWVTPDSPTLVDLPKGAEVLPDASKAGIMGAVSNIPRDRSTGAPIIINDYSALESRMAANTKAVTRALREHQAALTRQLRRQSFNAYLSRRI